MGQKKWISENLACNFSSWVHELIQNDKSCYVLENQNCQPPTHECPHCWELKFLFLLETSYSPHAFSFPLVIFVFALFLAYAWQVKGFSLLYYTSPLASLHFASSCNSSSISFPTTPPQPSLIFLSVTLACFLVFFWSLLSQWIEINRTDSLHSWGNLSLIRFLCFLLNLGKD